ncbi:MAG: hypothetical protein PHX87_00030 [Candidatus Peribacteraceae bacterium]|nr:hypothetical protein [Candidatus Peribacteraceae bacterium]MDD5741798.1 hypothetical protein [Candidatus Peribacteraceae bacterium]
MPKVLVAEDLQDEEIKDAFLMMQEGASPGSVIDYLRGERVRLLDPEQFILEVQQKFEQIERQRARTHVAATNIALPLLHDGPSSHDHLPARQ